MDFTKHQHRLGRLVERLNIMVIIVLGLLLSNLLTGALAWYGIFHQKVEVTPFLGGSAYQKSALIPGSDYLSMMTENFIYARFNVTPETVRSNHKHLLSFVDTKHYPKFLESLNKEARIVSTRKISSYFEIKKIALDEKSLRCTVTGKLKQAIKTRAFHEEPATYQIQYQYHLGRLMLTQFIRQDNLEASASKKIPSA